MTDTQEDVVPKIARIMYRDDACELIVPSDLRSLVGAIKFLRSQNKEMREALQELSAMYTYAWDTVDGGLLMMGSGIDRFEKAHAKAKAALSPTSKEETGHCARHALADAVFKDRNGASQ